MQLQSIQRGVRAMPPLFCVPILVKDNFDVMGMATTAGLVQPHYTSHISLLLIAKMYETEYHFIGQFHEGLMCRSYRSEGSQTLTAGWFCRRKHQSGGEFSDGRCDSGVLSAHGAKLRYTVQLTA